MLSDIVSGNGRCISQQAWEGIEATYCNKSTLQWPKISRPSEKMWKTWRMLLHKSLCSVKERYLDKPLLKWFGKPTG